MASKLERKFPGALLQLPKPVTSSSLNAIKMLTNREEGKALSSCFLTRLSHRSGG